MGFLDGILGGVVGAEMTSVVSNLIQQHGGVQGVIAQLEKQGMGDTVKSWVGTGANQAISPAQIQQAFGANGTLQSLASKFGLDPNVLSQKLSQALPHAIDHLTPGGTVPPSA